MTFHKRLSAFLCLLCFWFHPASLQAAAGEAFSRPTGGFAGSFESDDGLKIDLSPLPGGGFSGRYAPGTSELGIIVAKPGRLPGSLEGQILKVGTGERTFKVYWKDETLVLTVGDKTHLMRRSLPVIGSLSEIEDLKSLTLKRRWTIAVYLGADNDLERFALDDLQEMTDGLPASEVDVIVLCDRWKPEAGNPKDDKRDGDWTGAKLIRLNPGKPWVVLRDLGELDMSDPATLANFLTGAFKAYPAQNYAVWFWNHGGGFNGVVWDEGIPGKPGTTSKLSILDIRLGLQTAIQRTIKRPVDLIAFDACNMAQLEVALQVSDLGRYLVASEQIVPGAGYPYEKIMPLFGNPKSTAREVAMGIPELFISDYTDKQKEDTTLAAIDLQAIPTVAKSLSSMAFIAEVFKEKYATAVTRALYYAESYDARAHRLLDGNEPTADIRDLIDRMAEAMKPMPLDKWFDPVRESLEKAVIATSNGDSRRRSHGLAIFAPRTAGQNTADYRAVSPLASDNEWLALLSGVHAETAKQNQKPVTYSDVVFSSKSKGKPVVRPFNGDGVSFSLSGPGVIEVYHEDRVRQGPVWQILRRRWVADPNWMARSKQGGTHLSDIFMPIFNDEKNNLAVELTGQRFHVTTDGKEFYNVTLDMTNPDHGAPIVAQGRLLQAGVKDPIPVEVSFDPVLWTCVSVRRTGQLAAHADRDLMPDEEDKIVFLLETVDDKGKEGVMESDELQWHRGPLLSFAVDEPGRYTTTFLARTMRGLIALPAFEYAVEANPDLDNWAESAASFDLSKFKLDNAFDRNVVGPNGTLVDTGVVSFLRQQVGSRPGFFQVESELTLNGQPDTMTEYWLFDTTGSVPSMRVINRISGQPDLCWYGPVTISLERDRPAFAMKVMQMTGVIWKWTPDILSSLRLKPIKPKEDR